jgi:hypothetical protein
MPQKRYRDLSQFREKEQGENVTKPEVLSSQGARLV